MHVQFPVFDPSLGRTACAYIGLRYDHSSGWRQTPPLSGPRFSSPTQHVFYTESIRYLAQQFLALPPTKSWRNSRGLCSSQAKLTWIPHQA
jgi:hypothetical protein